MCTRAYVVLWRMIHYNRAKVKTSSRTCCTMKVAGSSVWVMRHLGDTTSVCVCNLFVFEASLRRILSETLNLHHGILSQLKFVSALFLWLLLQTEVPF